MEMRKNANLCKNILILIGVILSVFCSFSQLGADEKIKSTTEWIEIARKIQKIEEISDLKSKISIDSMVIYLNDEEPLIRRIATEKIGYIGDENMIVYLDKDDPYWYVRSACQDSKKMINIKRMLDSPSITELEKKQLIKKLVKDDLKSSVIIMKLYIEEKKVKTLEEISKEISELQSVLRLYEFDMKRALVKYSLDILPKLQRTKKAINLLIHWKTVYEYEAAILSLIETGTESLPYVLSLLNKSDNIPTKNAPPYSRIEGRTYSNPASEVGLERLCNNYTSHP